MMRVRLVFVCASVGLAATAGAAPAARVEVVGSVVTVVPAGPCAGYAVAVTGPRGYSERREFQGCEPQSLELAREGEALADGTYGFEVRLARGDGRATPTASGALDVRAGAAQVAAPLAAPEPEHAAPSPDDTVFTDDVIAPRACIGSTCADGESFGVATLKLKAAAPWIELVSNSPTTDDWVVSAGSSFLVSDLSTLLTPFSIAAGAPSNSIVVDASGRVGIGTATPFAQLTLVDPGSPFGVAYHAPGTGSGSTTWNTALNGAFFQIARRDVVSGLRGLELDSETGNALLTEAGHVVPQASLHVRRADGTARLLLEETNATVVGRNLLRLVNNGPATFRFDNARTAPAGASARSSPATASSSRPPARAAST